MKLTARLINTSARVAIEAEAGVITRLERLDEPGPRAEPWVAPAFWDLQMNGRWGISFSSPTITPDDVARIILAQRPLGAARVCPTLITAPVDHLIHGLQTIDLACRTHPEVARMVPGIHLEGPFISELDGYRGAHPLDAVRDPDYALFERLQDASGGRIVLVTLAPERPGSIDFIKRVRACGITVALGHTAADPRTLLAAAQAGASLSTHLGNGIAATLPRHPNPIWAQAADDRLSASFIVDGDHVDLATLRVLARAKGPARTILVSDLSPLAGLPPGRHDAWEILDSGTIIVAGTQYLAGSSQPLEVGLRNLLTATGWSLDELLATVTTNPARLLGLEPPRLDVGEPADLVLFRAAADVPFTLDQCYLAGAPVLAADEASS